MWPPSLLVRSFVNFSHNCEYTALFNKNKPTKQKTTVGRVVWSKLPLIARVELLQLLLWFARQHCIVAFMLINFYFKNEEINLFCDIYSFTSLLCLAPCHSPT